MSQFRAGTRPGERTAKAIREAGPDELAKLFPDQAAGATVSIPRCKVHRGRAHRRNYVVPGCDGCQAEQRALVAIAQKRDRVPRTLARRRRAWKEAGGGTPDFCIAEYDRLMEVP